MSNDILVVDDTPENLRLLATLLAKEGYNVRKALNGTMALTAVEAAHPDLILLDIMMPDVDGYTVCQRLKSNQQTANIPVIFLSAIAEGFNKAKAFEVGGVDYITKPFQIQEVLARVRNQLALRAASLRNEQLNAELEQRVKERTHQLETAQAQLLKMALYDSLTELPNRALFMERLTEALNQVQADASRRFAVLFLDCDRFKVVNDSLGHVVGDQLLVAISRRLETVLLPTDTLARLGGDEFAILLPTIATADPAEVANRLLKAFSQPFALENCEVFINASIGIALGDDSYHQPEHLLRDADTAMYRAKASGKACYQVFDVTMHEAAIQRLHLETDLRRALQRQEFSVHYQPIISLLTGKVIGFEALARWSHPQLGMVSPARFIPVAEDTGLIVPIDRWVLRQACQQLRLWQQERLVDSSLSISINLSAIQFTQSDLVAHIDQVLMETQLDPRCLHLEITESTIVERSEAMIATLQQLRDRQIQLSIDDFGTGYSSLSYLHLFPVSTLKIDRAFVQRIDGNWENDGLVLLIINIARTLGITVVAEGIETKEQLTQLRKLNCDFGQGYLFATPLDVEKATQLISSNLQW